MRTESNIVSCSRVRVEYMSCSRVTLQCPLRCHSHALLHQLCTQLTPRQARKELLVAQTVVISSLIAPVLLALGDYMRQLVVALSSVESVTRACESCCPIFSVNLRPLVWSRAGGCQRVRRCGGSTQLYEHFAQCLASHHSVSLEFQRRCLVKVFLEAASWSRLSTD
jgi:hypothetical protein